MLALDWGSVPAWLGSILTGSSLVIAALAYRRSVLDKEREQAAKITAWFELTERGPIVRLRNSSDGAIYEVLISVGLGIKDIDLRTVPPETTAKAGFRGTVGGRGVPIVRFRDSAGRYWRRDSNGQLEDFGGPSLSLRSAKKFWSRTS